MINKLEGETVAHNSTSQFWVKRDRVLVYNAALCFKNPLPLFPCFPLRGLSTSVAKELAQTRERLDSFFVNLVRQVCPSQVRFLFHLLIWILSGAAGGGGEAF